MNKEKNKLLENNYCGVLMDVLSNNLPDNVSVLYQTLIDIRKEGRSVYICGNGGSAANAMHIANDFLFVDGEEKAALNVEAIVSNNAVLTCLANDIGYENIFAKQLMVKAKKDDVLLVLSGSGNSENVVRAIEYGNTMGMKTFAILGFDGGKCKELAQYPIYFNINNMQILEDLQMIVGHICMKVLKADANNG